MQIYNGRTFRFCFTNSQMADAVADFIWKDATLRPDAAPIYEVGWDDDPYSVDLFERFHEILGPDRYGASLPRHTAPRPGVAANAANCFWTSRVPFSVGTFNEANRWETSVAERLIDMYPRASQKQPLLVLPANSQPAQRFLRALARAAPTEATRFVVATGDAIDFNTIYRDRAIRWPIQDLPFRLVFFCHQNPVDPVAFAPETDQDTASVPSPTQRSSTGTQDLMLYEEIVGTILEAAFRGPSLASTADELVESISESQLVGGGRRFDQSGNRIGGNGEYVVCLLPWVRNEHVLPEARLQVWCRRGVARPSQWAAVLIDGQRELLVSYMPGAARQPGGGEP
jgi:hypothetical protein